MGKASRRKRDSRTQDKAEPKSPIPSPLQNLPKKPVDLSLTLLSIAVGIIFWLLEKNPVTIVASLIIVFGLLVHPVWNLPWIDKSTLRRVLALVLLAIIVCVTGYKVWPSESKPTAPAKPVATTVFMECQMLTLPITIPPRSSIPVIPLNKRVMQQQKWGFYEIPNGSDKEQLWPSQKILDESRKLKNFGWTTYKCEVSNQGPDNIIYLGVPIDISFGNEKPPIRYEPIVSSLDVGKSFSFYVVNVCPVTTVAIWQDTAKVQTPQQPTTHNVPLRRKYRNQIEQVMMFLPSSVPWVRQLPCE